MLFRRPCPGRPMLSGSDSSRGGSPLHYNLRRVNTGSVPLFRPSAWAKVTARPNVPETVWVRIPRETYRKDARIEISLRKVSGGFVSLAGLKLFQREFRDKGYELSVVGGSAQSVRKLRASPSPFTTRTSICYSLAVPGRATVDILDAAGRVVCKLVDAELEAGEHRVSWKSRDEQGRAVAAGVYFCRLQTPDAAAVDRVVLLR